MSKYNELRSLIRQVANAKTRTERVSLEAQAVHIILALETERPAPDEALLTAYEEGALNAMGLLAETRKEHEESFKSARYSAAGIVLNGLENYGQTICSQAETRVNRHLNERRRNARKP